ncbi:MAG: PQQ-binding-like beta-propeller repeat protein, partial [candidate division WOR-3 bacterium]
MVLGFALITIVGCRQNTPPVVLAGPLGPEQVALRRGVGFSVVADDADRDRVRVRCDWGDGDTSEWSSEEAPACTLVLAHAWQRTGSYQVRCQAEDARSSRSAWSMPKTVLVSSSLPGSIIWTFQAQGDVRGVPAIGRDGTIIVAGEGGQVYALEPSGARRWRTDLGSRILSTPALGENGTVYIGTASSLCALSSDGRVKWRFPAAGPVDAGVALGRDGRMYVACRTSFFYALDTAGNLLWKQDVGGTLSSAAIGADGTVYVGGGD